MLDVGCSEGVYVAACSELGWDAYGLEIDKAKVERAAKRGLQVTQPDYENWQPEYFDFIMFRHVVEHIPDFMDTLDKIIPLLKIGGILCIETPNQAALSCYLRGRKIRHGRFLGHLYPPTHINAFTPATHRMIGRKWQMSIVRQSTYSPADPAWTFSSLYKKRGIVPLVHSISAKIGFGENLSTFFKKE